MLFTVYVLDQSPLIFADFKLSHFALLEECWMCCHFNRACLSLHACIMQISLIYIPSRVIPVRFPFPKADVIPTLPSHFFTVPSTHNLSPEKRGFWLLGHKQPLTGYCWL